jgi:predicted esterase
MEKKKLITEKTGRYFTLGTAGAHIRHVLFACHGYAQTADDFLRKFEDGMRDDIFIVAPEGLNRFYARSTSGRVAASWMTKEDREDDIRDYLIFLDKVYSDVMPHFSRRANIMAFGFSQGAATASRWVESGRSRVDELILWCGFFPPDLAFSKIPENVKMKIVTASEDPFISADEAKEMLAAQKKLVPALTHFQFEGGHEINTEAFGMLFPEESSAETEN